jgi:stage III sporulation protein AG
VFPATLFNIKEPQMKLIKNLAILALLGILLIFIGNIFTQKPDTFENTSVGNTNDDEAVTSSGTVLQYEAEKTLKSDLVKILSQIEGVGRVSVELTYESGPEYELAYDRQVTTSETEERDDAGGIRRISEMSEEYKVVLVKDKTEQPVIVREIRPKLRGVLVVAEGADNSRVKAMLFNAVQAVLDLPAHKIQVLPAK